jgi:glycosyltransferase involved in cell wall biosynthesis
MSMGGAQRSLAKISSELSQIYNVKIVVFNKNHAEAKAFKTDVITLDVESGANPAIKIIAFVRRILRLRAIKRNLNIHVSISFLEGADYVNILSSIGEKVVLSIRGSKVHDEHMHGADLFIRRWLIKILYKRASAIVCVNKGIANEMSVFYSIKNIPMRVVPNFYDLLEIQRMAVLPIMESETLLFDRKVIIMSGRLAVEKGHSFVINLFSELRKSRNDVRLILLGDGSERQSIIEQAESLKLSIAYKTFSNHKEPDVFITGDKENVFQYLRHATIYLLNSSSEGFPNGLAEAMACGVPVISADCPYGPREILSKVYEQVNLVDAEFADYGILLPTPKLTKWNTDEAWLKVLNNMLDSSELRARYSNVGIQRISEFSKENVINKWINVIDA